MRSHRRRGPLPHVLVAADASEVESIRAILALLPDTTYGQVFLEVADGAERPVVVAPARVAVTYLSRSEHAPGVRLGQAVVAWAHEWMPDEHAFDRDLAVWAGSTVRVDVRVPAGLLQPL